MNLPVSIADVQRAAQVVQEHVHRTPIVTCSALNSKCGYQIFFKCENLQKVGAFKFRGAINALANLSDAEKKRGVITHSSGNHGQALALAGKTFSIPVTVVMPNNAPSVKKEAVVEYGADVVFCEPTLEARESTVERIRSTSGATLVPPFDHPDIIAGQGTAALELIEQVSEMDESLDALIAPIGGGGLISGSCVVGQANTPPIPVYASEPTGADDAFRSKKSGELVPSDSPNTIADGLLTSLGTNTWPFVRDVVEQVITVSDEEIVTAMKLMWARAKLVVEPSSATAFAALVSPDCTLPAGSKVGMIISGGNVDLSSLPW